MNSCTYNLRPATPVYQNLVDSITRSLNINPIKVYASDTENACATMIKNNSFEKEPIITYNPKFINKLVSINKWAAITVFAHEVAHHYNLDLRGAFLGSKSRINKTSHKQELNADYVAGWILRCKGATLEDTRALHSILNSGDSPTHPSSRKRILEMRNGWQAAHCKFRPKRRVTKKKDYTGLVLGLSALALVGIGIAATSKS